MTSMDLSTSYDDFLVAGHNAPRFTSGFFIEAVGCPGYWAWLARLHTMLPFGNITVLHASLDELDTVALILPPMLAHLPCLHELCFLVGPTYWHPHQSSHRARSLVELYLGALLPTTGSGPAVVCPQLHVLGLEVELAHGDFPFSALEHVAAARKDAGHPLRGFEYHPRTRRYDVAGTRARFAESFVPLAALVGGEE